MLSKWVVLATKVSVLPLSRPCRMPPYLSAEVGIERGRLCDDEIEYGRPLQLGDAAHTKVAGA